MSPAATSRESQASRGEQTRPEDRGSREEQVIDRITAVRKRRPRLTDEAVTLAHGAGGKSSAALVDSVFVEAFRNPQLEQLGDGAVLTLPSGERLAFSTDSFVVSPLRFPGGSIGHLAVHGTVNDLAVSGAVPRWLSAAFVIEEGFAVSDLRAIAADMAAAAKAADVTLVTGDTKVVPKGSADGLYITTAGVGLIPPGRELSAARVRPGDKVLLSGTLADHGMAVMLARGDLGIEAGIRSDTAAVGGAVEAVLAAAPGTRWMRDPTRGGLGTVCNELAADAGVAVILDEEALPVAPLVQSACDLLGIDPMYVACEGKFAAVVPAEEADAALAALRAHSLGRDACVVGEIRDDPAGVVALRNAFGGTRIVDMLVGRPSVAAGG